MDPSLYSMKFSELRTYAKSLGLSDLPAKKEPLLELIKSHFETKPAAAEEEKAAKPKRKVGRAPKSEAKQAENQEQAIVAVEKKEPDEEKQPKKVKKLKKEKSKTKLEEQPAVVIVADEQPAQDKPTKTKKVKKTAKTETQPTEAAKTEEVVEPKEKRTKKRAKKQEEATTAVVQEPEQTAPVETKKKKTKKRPSDTNQPEDEDPSPAKKAKVTKKTKKVVKKSKSKTKLAEPIPNPETSEAKPEEKSMGDEFELRMDEESIEQAEPAQVSVNNNSKRQSARLATPKHNSTVNLANQNPHSSIMTNDEEEIKKDETVELDNDPNITKDIANETFDKSPELEANKIEVAQSANMMPCSSFYSQKTPAKPAAEAKQEVSNEATDEKPKIKAGGARIVRPKQTVVEVVKTETSKSEEEVVVVKKVDIVQREAGPRIVKPTGVEDSNKKGDEPVVAKKNKIIPGEVKSVTKKAQKENEPKPAPKIKIGAPAPNFKALHEKEASKMESLDAFYQRTKGMLQAKPAPAADSTNQNAANDQEKPTTSTIAPVVKTKTPMSAQKTGIKSKLMTVINNLNNNNNDKKTPSKPSTSTPKLAKTIVNTASNIISNIESNIPRFLGKKQETALTVPKIVIDEPKTPTQTTASNEKPVNIGRTPSSVSARPTISSLLKSVQKTQSFKVANKLNESVSDKNNGPVTASNLASSSFNRRKSYDLNSSLSKPLGYNPHIGKLKPIDFSSKSIFLESCRQVTENKNTTILKNTSTNMNESSVKPKSPKALELAKKRLSIFKSSSVVNGVVGSDRNAITDQVKAQNLKKITDESTQVAKKIRHEKIKKNRNEDSDKRRQIENNENANPIRLD